MKSIVKTEYLVKLFFNYQLYCLVFYNLKEQIRYRGTNN